MTEAQRGRYESGAADGTHRPEGGAGSEGAPDAHGAADGGAGALERELTVLFRRARAAQAELARQVHPGLEAAAYGLLVRLAEVEPERATDLAAYFGVGKATMSRQLRAMEELGLVAREPDPADGRAYLVRMTGEGRERFSRVRRLRRERYLGQVASWDPADVTALARLLHRLNDTQPG